MPKKLFKKGESGNPKGRPAEVITKGDLKKLLKAIRENTAREFYEEASKILGSVIKSGMLADAIMIQVQKGNLSGFEILLNYVIGKPEQLIDIKNSDGSIGSTIQLTTESKKLLIERLNEC